MRKNNLAVKFCKKCVTPNSRPRVVFDSNGVCNACNFVSVKKSTDWKKREKEFGLGHAFRIR